MVLADRGDRGLRHVEPPGAAGLRAPDIDRLELARDRHRREHAHLHVERALEPHIGAEIGDPAGDLRRMQKHREGTLHRAAARDDRVEGVAVFRGDLVLAGDRWKSCHLVSSAG